MVRVLFFLNFFRNVLCIPIIDHTGGECLNTVQLENKLIMHPPLNFIFVSNSFSCGCDSAG